MSIAESLENDQSAGLALQAVVRREVPGRWLQIGTCRGFEWTAVRLPIPNLPAALEGFRIVHLSDFHMRAKWDKGYDDLISIVEKNPPDLVLFTGDFVDYRYDVSIGWPNAKKLLSGLKSRLGIVAILGNHDDDLLAPKLMEMGVTMIDQRRLLMPAADAALEFIGVAGVDRADVDLDFLRSLGQTAPGTVRIVLSHFGDTILQTEFLRPDLFLCGHTHGGQICLPGRMPILRHDRLPRRLCSGVHRAFGTWLVVNRGMGFSSEGCVRIFCPAEAIEITLTRAKAG